MKRGRIAKLLCVLLPLVLIGVCAASYFLFDWQIPRDQKLVRLYAVDVFRGKHTVLGEGTAAVVVTIEGLRETDDRNRRSLYAYSSKNGRGSFWYPGTPKGQIKGYPRLRRGERLVLVSAEAGERQQDFWLFRIGEADGTEYVYPLYYDDEIIPLTVLGESLPFRDDDERRIYDLWYDEDVYKWLAKTGHSAPVFRYKTTLGNLLENAGRLTRNGGR